MNTIINKMLLNTLITSIMRVGAVKKAAGLIGLMAMLAMAQPAVAEDRLQLDETNIQGASELPKVLYIVPWKKAEVGDKPVKVNRLVDEVLSPVDRDVLNREIRFYEQSQAQ
ncbi:MAG: hypothetical protein L0Z73_18890 [Gammaproteobacteria bacterium]|nr:hypothetical protein [Gammaproteobacteria bacterium]